MFSISLKDSVKFLFFVCAYLGYPFVLYFAIAFPVNRLTEHKNEFQTCRQMYVYSAFFLGLYLADALRYIIYVLLSLFSHVLASKMGTGMFIVNSLLLSYGVFLVYMTEKDCLADYDIKDYLCVSGIGLLFSIITYIYNNYDNCFNTEQKTSLNFPLLHTDGV